MPLSARRGLKPRKHKAAAVGMVSRSLSALVDSILPSATLLALFATGVMSLRLFDPLPEVTRVDAVFRRLYETPRLGVRVVANWMLLWTAFTLIFYGLFKNSPGKLLLRLTIRQSDGRVASTGRLLLRIVSSWLVPVSLGVSFLWILIAPDRRALHDTVSGTYVVRDKEKPRSLGRAVSSEPLPDAKPKGRKGRALPPEA